MYQREMFSDGSFKDAKYIASGCFGSVYTHPEHQDWVIKYGRADGTLNYLEWCKAMQAAGKGMKGMPEIDILTLMAYSGYSGYMVTMRRYEDARMIINKAIGEYSGVEELYSEHGHDYLGELVEAFDEYCSDVLVRVTSQTMVDDLHRANIMWDARKSEFVITDPSCSNYCKTNTVEFNLH